MLVTLVLRFCLAANPSACVDAAPVEVNSIAACELRAQPATAERLDGHGGAWIARPVRCRIGPPERAA